MSWGNKLVLVFIGFAFLIGTLVYKSMHTKFELVSKDYYNDELRYQDKIDGKVNAAKISSVTVVENTEAIIINLPSEHEGRTITGEAWFYCSNNASFDRKISLSHVVHNQLIVLKKDLGKTNYRLKLSWEDSTIKYYDEKLITIH